jgi:hypothetical protein
MGQPSPSRDELIAADRGVCLAKLSFYDQRSPPVASLLA